METEGCAGTRSTGWGGARSFSLMNFIGGSLSAPIPRGRQRLTARDTARSACTAVPVSARRTRQDRAALPGGSATAENQLGLSTPGQASGRIRIELRDVGLSFQALLLPQPVSTLGRGECAPDQQAQGGVTAFGAGRQVTHCSLDRGQRHGWPTVSHGWVRAGPVRGVPT